MVKVYKKKSNKKTKKCCGKKKRFSRKMKGGVAFNTSFSTSSLPSGVYIPLNENVNANPSWNQVDARLLPSMKGGKRTRKNRRKTRKVYFYLKKVEPSKNKKSRRKIKMKGGSLVGTDLVTGINTTDTNEVLAFGTTGGTNYMLDTLSAKQIDSGEFLSPDLRPIPMV